MLHLPTPTAERTFETVLTGTVVMSAVYTQPTPSLEHHAAATRLHVMAKQDNGLLFEAVQVIGTGPDAQTRGAVMRGRVKPGARIEAHGAFVGLTGTAAGDPPRLLLHGVSYIRSRDVTHTPALPAPQVASILNRLAERVPGVARGMQQVSNGA